MLKEITNKIAEPTGDRIFVAYDTETDEYIFRVRREPEEIDGGYIGIKQIDLKRKRVVITY